MVAENQPGHIDQIKQTNAGAVYRLIDQLGPVSRIDLSRLAQLAPASITKIVREMLEAHLVQELEIKEAGNRGRPAVGLVVETEAWHYLSLRISRGEIFLALRDLSSKLVVEESQELALKDDLPLLDRIISHIDQFFIRHQKKLERLTSIAITLPGIIDTENGIVHRMPFYEDVKEMPLGEALEQHTGVPVYIQHDISAWTMAEALFGASRGARDVIQVVIDHNVGAGVITDGHLLHAGSSSLVEIGHTQVDPYGKRCYCGNHGCLETIASVDSILELAQLRLNQSMSSMLHGQPLTVDSLCQAALRGDLLAKDIITGVGAHVGRILAIMVNLFNPQKILIGSPLSKAADILFPVISDSIRQQALPAYSQHISVESTQFSNQGTMAGAALVKDAMYTLPEAVSRRSLGLPAEKICSVYRESDIVPGEQTATSILKQRTKNLAPLPYAHQQQKSPQEKTVVSITVDPESPESFMKLPKRRRWVKEKYTRWVKTQPCACCGMPADDPHHLIGHGQGGMGTKAHDLFVLPLCRKHHNELHTDTVAFEDKYGSQLELIFRFIDRALAIGVLA